MLELGLMIEAQNGLTWDRWRALVRAAERLGFAGIYRNDHFMNPSGPHLPALELWSSLTWVATNSERIEFGPLVSPFSFRHPVIAAWTGAAIDDLSKGRLQLGFGVGWLQREHTAYGFELLELDRRFARFEEGLTVVTALLKSDFPTDFDGNFFRLENALLLPRPSRPGGPPIVIGGNGPTRTLPLVARFADEWNAVAVNPERFRELNIELDRLLELQGRAKTQVRRTLMNQAIVARTRAEAESKIEDPVAFHARGAIAGTPDDVIAHFRDYVVAGVQRIMLRWLDLDGLESLELIGREVLPHLQFDKP